MNFVEIKYKNGYVEKIYGEYISVDLKYGFISIDDKAIKLNRIKEFRFNYEFNNVKEAGFNE